MKVEYKDGYTVLDGIVTSISEESHRRMMNGTDHYRKILRIGKAVLANPDRYPEFKNIIADEPSIGFTKRTPQEMVELLTYYIETYNIKSPPMDRKLEEYKRKAGLLP